MGRIGSPPAVGAFVFPRVHQREYQASVKCVCPCVGLWRQGHGSGRLVHPPVRRHSMLVCGSYLIIMQSQQRNIRSRTPLRVLRSCPHWDAECLLTTRCELCDRSDTFGVLTLARIISVAKQTDGWPYRNQRQSSNGYACGQLDPQRNVRVSNGCQRKKPTNRVHFQSA